MFVRQEFREGAEVDGGMLVLCMCAWRWCGYDLNDWVEMGTPTFELVSSGD